MADRTDVVRLRKLERAEQEIGMVTCYQSHRGEPTLIASIDASVFALFVGINKGR